MGDWKPRNWAVGVGPELYAEPRRFEDHRATTWRSQSAWDGHANKLVAISWMAANQLSKEPETRHAVRGRTTWTERRCNRAVSPNKAATVPCSRQDSPRASWMATVQQRRSVSPEDLSSRDGPAAQSVIWAKASGNRMAQPTKNLSSRRQGIFTAGAQHTTQCHGGSD